MTPMISTKKPKMPEKPKLRKQGRHILATCSQCSQDTLVAHWSRETEEYLFIDEEPYSCRDCRSLEAALGNSLRLHENLTQDKVLLQH